MVTRCWPSFSTTNRLPSVRLTHPLAVLFHPSVALSASPPSTTSLVRPVLLVRPPPSIRPPVLRNGYIRCLHPSHNALFHSSTRFHPSVKLLHPSSFFQPVKSFASLNSVSSVSSSSSYHVRHFPSVSFRVTCFISTRLMQHAIHFISTHLIQSISSRPTSYNSFHLDPPHSIHFISTRLI